MNIALVAHDNKKRLMENLCIAYRHILNKHQLYATDTTGRHIEEASNLIVNKFLAGHLGGIQQLCSQITFNEIDLVIILRDPEGYKDNQADITNIMMLCDGHNIPMATNLATAEAMLMALDRGEFNWRNNLD